MAVFLVLHDVAKPDQTGQQTVDRAFGQPGLLCQPLQTDPCGVRRQMLNELKDALHALYAAFFCHDPGLPMKFNKNFIILYGRQTVPAVPHYTTEKVPKFILWNCEIRWKYAKPPFLL